MKLRQSEFQTFMSCRRQWYYRYVLLRRDEDGDGMPTPAEPNAAHLGTVIHGGIGAYYLGEDPIKGANNSFEMFAPPADDEGVTLIAWQQMLAKAHKIVNNYVCHVRGAGVDLETVTEGVEEEYEMELLPALRGGEPVVLTGKMDRVYVDRRFNSVTLQDHKTTSASLHSKLLMSNDFQALTYGVLYRATHGMTPAWFEHNLIKTVTGEGRTKPPTFWRNTISLNDRVLDGHLEHLRLLADDMRCYLEQRRPPDTLYPRVSRDCTWQCGYRPACEEHSAGGDWVAVLEEGADQRLRL